MEPVTNYRPPFYLGNRFIDGNRREFEIIETHWGIPGEENQGIGFTYETQSGKKIHMYGAPKDSVLQKIGFRQVGKDDARINTQSVEMMQELIDERKIVMK